MKQLDKLNRQLAEAEAALEARKKPPEDTGPRIVGEGLVIDEWVNLNFYPPYSFIVLASLFSFLSHFCFLVLIPERTKGEISSSAAGWSGWFSVNSTFSIVVSRCFWFCWSIRLVKCCRGRACCLLAPLFSRLIRGLLWGSLKINIVHIILHEYLPGFCVICFLWILSSPENDRALLFWKNEVFS